MEWAMTRMEMLIPWIIESSATYTYIERGHHLNVMVLVWMQGILIVMSSNTHKTIADKFQSILDSSNHPFHLHTTSEIPGTKFPCLNLSVINFWPWTLSIVKSCLLFLSNPAFLCLYSCIHCPAVFPFTLLLPPSSHPLATSDIPD